MILYLHGFRSSPLSAKAQLIQQAVPPHDLLLPQLPASPRQAIDLCLDLVAHLPKDQLCIIGSSLGGYYATYLANTLHCRAVCINPSVYAARDLATQLDVKTTFHHEQSFEFKASYLKELADLFQSSLHHPEHFLLLAGMQDEVLDWQEMQARYQGAKQIIVPDQNHAFQDFADYLPIVLDFIDTP